MGSLTWEIKVVLRVDNNNGPAQGRDAWLALDVERRIQELLTEPQYAHLHPTML